MTVFAKDFYYKNNRLQQLRGFYYSIQFNSISKAAQFMRLNQSAVSMQIQSLERDLGLKLLQRKGPQFHLTEAGQKFYSMSLPYVEGLDSLYENFHTEYKKNTLQQLNIAANHISILHLLPKYLKEYKTLHPEVHVSIHNIGREEALQRLKENKIHMVIYPAQDLEESFIFTPIQTYKTVLVVKKGHPLTREKNLTLDKVAEYELVRIDPHLITVPMFEENINRHGLKSKITFENGDWEILKHMVKAGIGVAILSSICTTDGETDLVTIPLSRYFPSITYGIITKKGRIAAPQAENFTNLFTSGRK